MNEVQAPSEHWLRVLSDHGIAILIVLFLLFVAIPAVWIAGKSIIHWTGERIVDLSQAIKEFMDSISQSAAQSVKTQEEVKSLLAARNAVDHDWHDEKLRKLHEIDSGVRTLHDKVDDLKEHVTRL